MERAERFELSEMGMVDAWLEVFEYTDRPTFILDLTCGSITPIYYNKILRDRTDLRNIIASELAVLHEQHLTDDFCQWILAEGNGLEGCHFADYNWMNMSIGLRWKVIVGILCEENKGHKFSNRLNGISQDVEQLSVRKATGSQFEVDLDFSRERSPSLTVSTAIIPNWYENVDSFDWTNPEPVFNLSEHAQFLRSFDWSSTPLGPIQRWSKDLRRKCVFLLSDCRPAALYYGEKKILIYNEGYISIIGSKHPAMLGQPWEVAWESIADRYYTNFIEAARTGRATSADNALVDIQRSGYTEEAYFSWLVIPNSGSDGMISYYNPVFETTRQVISERRMQSLLSLGQNISTVTSLSNFWHSVLDGLRPDVHDVPLCLLYSTSADNSQKTSYVWKLEGTIGIEGDLVECFSTPSSYAKLQQAFQSGKPTLLHTADGSLSPKCVEHIIPRGSGDKVKSAVILAITVSSKTLGFLILGINPRRPYDSDYADFLHILGGMLATAGASALRGQQVVEQLAIKSQEAKDNETRFRRMADAAPVGMFQTDANGQIQYANHYWHSITEHSKRDDTHQLSWIEFVLEDDVSQMQKEWDKIIHGRCPVTFEIRLKKPWLTNEMIGTTAVQGPTWILVAAYPEFYPDGSMKGVIGCITDISRQKWAEIFQKQRTEQAVEMKRMQEIFIDVTSHELRNPMSAILHCADEICSSLSQFENMAAVEVDAKFRDWVAEMADAVSTIIHCSEHQKRIIDDILTLSKLESDLLIITPVDAQPLSIIHTAMKMFEGELHKGDVRMDLIIGKSFNDLQVGWARLDSSRLLQVIINLVGNAIKFTRTEQRREIQIIVNASLDTPSNGTFGIDYLPTRHQRADNAKGKDWGNGRLFYLHISITDTGRGLNPAEKTLMFQRFVQANPRTQVQYGGSGLGLFISKELTERQGGAIGVESEAGVGSTFAFYIKARRSISPEQPSDFDILQPINVHDISAVASDSQVQSKPATPIGTPSSLRPISPRLNPKPSLRPSEASRHVLIVEDNLVNQRVLSRQLKNIGCEVHVSNHGLEALSFVENSCFWHRGGNSEGGSVPLSLILMDLEMPVMTGLECVSKIRELQAEGTILGHIPVIAVTANARNEQLLDAEDCGMDAVVTKPFRIPELVSQMERLVSRYMESNTSAGSWPIA